MSNEKKYPLLYFIPPIFIASLLFLFKENGSRLEKISSDISIQSNEGIKKEKSVLNYIGTGTLSGKKIDLFRSKDRNEKELIVYDLFGKKEMNIYNKNALVGGNIGIIGDHSEDYVQIFSNGKEFHSLDKTINSNGFKVKKGNMMWGDFYEVNNKNALSKANSFYREVMKKNYFRHDGRVSKK